MSQIHLSNATGNIQRLNSKLEEALQTARRAIAVNATAKQGLIADNQLSKTSNTTSAIASSNVNFTWTGSTLTISWPAGYVQSLNGKNYPITKGSFVGVAHTHYTVFWNPTHLQMVFSTGANLVALTTNTNNINLCSLYTGTSGESGWVGGPGGSPQGSGTIGLTYKNF